MTLNELKIGESAIIREVGGQGSLRQHFLDMGVIPGALVTLIKYAPMGDPVELLIHGYKLTLRISDAEQLVVEPADAKSLPESVSLRTKKCLIQVLEKAEDFIRQAVVIRFLRAQNLHLPLLVIKTVEKLLYLISLQVQTSM